MHGASFVDLPVALVEKTFEHLVVLKPGRFFRDPGSADSSIQKPLANYEPRVIKTPRYDPFGVPIVRVRATDFQPETLTRHRVLKPVNISDLPTPPVECHPAVLTVRIHFYKVAAGLLYSKNAFEFRSSEALNAFVDRVNDPTPSGDYSYPRVGTKAIRRLYLHRQHMKVETLGSNNLTLWV